MLGAVLPARNNAWLNAGPPAWLIFNADNGDNKFPMKLPIIPETHEKIRLFDIDRKTCCDGVSDLDLLPDAGYTSNGSGLLWWIHSENARYWAFRAIAYGKHIAAFLC